MQQAAIAPDSSLDVMPDHTQLPDQDGTLVQNFQEYPQSELLTGSLLARLDELHPDGQFCLGQDSGIYWRHTTPPLDGCKAPDWFYVPGVSPMLEGQTRRSYVLWKEGVRPSVVIEYVSGDGSEERDATPHRGKFWVYENGIGAAYYAIYEVEKSSVEVYSLQGGRYVRVAANAVGRFPVPPLGVDLGIWEGTFRGMTLPWLRVWDSASGVLLPSADERIAAERERAETSESLLDDTRKLLDEEADLGRRLAQRLRELGVDPGTV